jgi:hypothetical protein
MKCPKCGYISFDSNLECPKCRSDISMEQRKLNLPPFKPYPPLFLGAIVETKGQASKSYPAEAESPGRDGSIGSTDFDAAERIGVDGDINYEDGVGYKATEEDQSPSDFPPPPPYFKKQLEEIKQLLSKLMPEKRKTGLDGG